MQKFRIRERMMRKILHQGKSVREFSHQGKVVQKFSHQGKVMRNSVSTWHSCLQMAINSSFQLWFAHRLKHWTPDFPIFETIYSMYIMDSSKYSKFVFQLLSFWISHSMPRLRIAMRNCFMMDFFLLSSSLHLLMGLEAHSQGLHKILPHSWLASMIKKLPKTPKLAKNWFKTFARVLNVLIELKGINYYSKVFKRVYNKL